MPHHYTYIWEFHIDPAARSDFEKEYLRKRRPRNIEIKAHVDSLEALAAKATALADQSPVEIAQDDTFFRCDAGRLKLRDLADDGSGELIYYRRANQLDPRNPSTFSRLPHRPLPCAKP